MLAQHVRPPRRGHQAALGFGLGSACAAMSLAVVDDDLEGAAELLQTVYDFGQIEVVGNDADLGLVGDGLVERLQDRGARLEAHPCKRGGAVGMGRGEVEALGGERRHQRVDRAVLDIAVDEGLRGDEAAREGDVASWIATSCGSPVLSLSCASMNMGVTRYLKSPTRSALRGKCTQRNFWIGD